MERGNQRAVARAWIAEKRIHALAHLISGFIGEGHGQNCRTRYPMNIHQVGNPVGDHASLPAAGTGQQQQGAFNVGNRFFLLRIQAFEEIHSEGYVSNSNRTGLSGQHSALCFRREALVT